MAEVCMQGLQRDPAPLRRRAPKAPSRRCMVAVATAGLVALPTVTALSVPANAAVGHEPRAASTVRATTSARVPHATSSCAAGQEQMTFTNSSAYPSSQVFGMVVLVTYVNAIFIPFTNLRYTI